MRGARRAASLSGRFLLAAVGSLAALIVIEVALRVATQSSFSGGAQGSHVMDARVGLLPKPGISGRHPSKGFTITIGDHGTRHNGNESPPTERPLTLAVGDSFTFGEDVDDGDSWPAALQRLSGKRVINGGVPGFGLDQTVLRAEQLAEIYAPDIVVVGFIPYDVLRCEMSYYSGYPKPYFVLDGAGLRWHPAPTPASRRWWSAARRLLSRSLLANVLLGDRYLSWEGPQAERVHSQGREVGCRLMARIAALGLERRLRVVVLAQPQQPAAPQGWELEIKDRVLACAREHGLATFDFFATFETMPGEERERLFVRDGHMNPEGNRLLAAGLARVLKDAPPSSRPSES